MKANKTYSVLLLILFVLMVLSMLLGTVYKGFEQSFDLSNAMTQLRLSRTVTAIVVGIGISVSGLLLQTLFRNPLAGPSVLGISSGATLGVSVGLLLLPMLGITLSSFSVTLLGIIGSFCITLMLLITTRYINNNNTLLIIGLMLGYFTSSIINVLSFYTDKSSLQELVFWGLGSFTKEISLTTIGIYSSVIILLVMCSIVFVKRLDLYLLGDNYARALGLNVKQTRYIIILIASLLIGLITSWCGPIAFIGIAVPHIARNILKSSKHFNVILISIIIGAILALVCDIISRLPGLDQTLPLNAVTSIIGAPLVIWIIFKNKLV